MNKKLSRFFFMLALVFAGEMIFSLPFHTTRYFRPIFLTVFDFSNTQLGDVFAFYGLVAMCCYFLGGPIADRFSPRGLMTVSLVATAAGGVYLATIPAFVGAAMVFAWWGFTSVFLFWAAMIRAAREWGGDLSQGLAFGILDGARGLAAAAIAVLAVILLERFMPDNMDLVTAPERREAMRAVILLYSGMTLLAGGLIWCATPPIAPSLAGDPPGIVHAMLQVMRRPISWTHALVIVIAYCTYKGLDNYSLYAVQVLGMDEVEAARFTAYAGYLRPVGCIVAGVFADKVSATKMIALSFALMTGIYAFLAITVPSQAWTNIIFANFLVSYIFVYAFRGLYYALLHETQVPKHLTGTTVGFVAFIGYTPDVFFGAVTGRLLDASPGLAGHQKFFLFLTCMVTLGLVATLVLAWLNRRERSWASTTISG